MSVPAFNPFALKTVFTLQEAACAVVGVVDAKENLEAVKSVFRELEHTFPPTKKSKRVCNEYFDTWYTHEWAEHAKIPRADLLAWCELKGIRPPLLFPDPPAAEPDRLPNKEANTVYTLLAAALVQQFGRDALHDRKAFIKTWLDDLAGCGIELPIKDNRTLVAAIEKAALKVDSLYSD